MLNRYLAVTSYDSGVRHLSEEEISAGWLLTGDVAYSPLIISADTLKFQRDGLESPGYDEWYVLPKQRELGEVFHGEFFEFQPGGGQILAFVNILDFVLHDPTPSMPGILDIFWSQLISIAPETFIADGHDCLTVVSRNEELIRSLHERIAARL